MSFALEEHVREECLPDAINCCLIVSMQRYVNIRERTSDE